MTWTPMRWAYKHRFTSEQPLSGRGQRTRSWQQAIHQSRESSSFLLQQVAYDYVTFFDVYRLCHFPHRFLEEKDSGSRGDNSSDATTLAVTPNVYMAERAEDLAGASGFVHDEKEESLP